jgi:hypothetical protein
MCIDVRQVEEKVFFFEKKNQKTFARLAARKATMHTAKVSRAQEQKFFASFFQKRRLFLPCLCLAAVLHAPLPAGARHVSAMPNSGPPAMGSQHAIL